MKARRFGKKAVSPLIATVLLIAFAVALGALVMNWGREYIEQTQEKVSTTSAQQSTCSFDVSMQLLKIGEKPCFDRSGRTFYAIIENGNYELTGYKVTVFGNDNNIYDSDATATVKKVESKLITVPINSTDPDFKINKAMIIPKVKIAGAKEDTFCTNAEIEMDDVPSSDSCK